jgi:hypothetical protein
MDGIWIFVALLLAAMVWFLVLESCQAGVGKFMGVHDVYLSDQETLRRGLPYNGLRSHYFLGLEIWQTGFSHSTSLDW